MSNANTTPRPFEIGAFTFGELTAAPGSTAPADPSVRLREFIDLAKLADQAGLDVFGVGEHHRHDFAIASPAAVLAAIAQTTERIRLTSAVTVLSTSDPVKVFEDFTAVDLISGGRAEITAGRGAYTESFALYGKDLGNYDELFEENLDLLEALNTDATVTWSGRHRPSLDRVEVYPRPVDGRLPVWVAIGGTPSSVVRAGRLGLPVYFAILGQPERFAPLAELYRRTWSEAGHSADRQAESMRSGVTSHFFAASTSQQARDVFHPYYANYIGNNMPRGRGAPLSRAAFDQWSEPHGALIVGSPAEVVEKILWERELLGHDRFLAQIGLGGLPFAETARSIELLATEILPAVRKAIGTTDAGVARTGDAHPREAQGALT